MKKTLLICFVVLVQISTSFSQVPAPINAYPQKTILLGGVAHIGNGQVIQNSAIAIENGFFKFVKDQMKVRIDVSQYDTVIHLDGAHVYPGFILPNNILGITEIDAVRATRDYDDVGQYNPNLKASIAFNIESKIIYTVRNNGVLLTQVTPRGGVISGASGIMRLNGWNYTDAAVQVTDGIHLNWPQRYQRNGAVNNKSDLRIDALYQFFKSAQAYCKSANPTVNLKYEAMRPLFLGQQNLYVHAQTTKEIMQAIQFKKEFGISHFVIVGGYDSGKLTNELSENNIPVILSNLHSLPTLPEHAVHYLYSLPKTLHEAGVLFCLDASGDMEAMNSRNLPFLAGESVGYGLSKEEALKLITLNTAKILGIDQLYGSIAAGKKATLFVSTGDALDMRTNQVILAWIDGVPLVLDDTQKQLYHKYMKRYQLH